MTDPKKPAGKLRLEYRTPAELDDNPANWREHPESQLVALDELIGDPEIGYAGACLYNERTGRLIDGHARKKRALDKGEKFVPVLIGNWSEEAEAKILASLDPVAAMARTNAAKQSELLSKLSSDSRASVEKILAGAAHLAGELDQQAAQQAKGGVTFKTITPAPPTTFALIAIDTLRWGEVAQLVEQLAAVPGILIETVSTGA